MTELLTAIVLWLSANYPLPASYEHPKIEQVPATEITYLRHRAFTPERRREVAAALAQSGDASSGSKARAVVAIYDDSRRTIFLPDSWTGKTPAELSVLVHEMVHHLQFTGQLKFECPAQREALAYQAQDQWLGLYGKSLAGEFDLDAFTLKVSTSCGF
jgi:hypothetical protein